MNYLGTDSEGDTGLGNRTGVRLHYVTAVIVRENLISGNTIDGVLIAGGGSSEIRLNYIGTGLGGGDALPNGDNGITMYDGANGTIIDGNVISGNGSFADADPGWGIDIQHSGALAVVTGTVITSNIIGLDSADDMIRRGAVDYIGPGESATGSFTNFGPVQRGNAGGGIRINRGNATLIGAAGQGNTISGNSKEGVRISGTTSTSPVLAGNRIGTTSDGTIARGNGSRGVEVIASSAVIGTPAAGNVISGNIRDGVFADGNTTIQDNLIGLDATGTVAMGNGMLADGGTPTSPGCCHAGVFIVAPANKVARNVISGHTGQSQVPGIRSGGALGALPNIIEDNKIGTNVGGGLAPVPNETPSGPSSPSMQAVGGLGPLPNEVGIGLFGDKSGTIIRRNTIAYNTIAGVFVVEGSSGATIGGGSDADANTIRNNGTGIIVGYSSSEPDDRIKIATNAIYGNDDLGIDLGWDGATPNDTGDGDAGPNGLQNFPVLTSPSNAGVTTNVDFALDSLQINANHIIQVFANAVCHGSGNGEGERLVGSFVQMTDGAGDALGVMTLTELVPVGQSLTATATDEAGNTSEFSTCVHVTAPAPAFTAWSASGNGTTNVTNNGVTTGQPQMTYQHNGYPIFSGAWQFSTVAADTRTVHLDWGWDGFHSFYMVTAKLEVFVRRGGVDVSVVTLLNVGPTSCCDEPSDGFGYNGVTQVAVQTGDTYGFRLYGSHYDGTYALQGTLSVIVDGTEAPLPLAVLVPDMSVAPTMLAKGPQFARDVPQPAWRESGAEGIVGR